MRCAQNYIDCKQPTTTIKDELKIRGASRRERKQVKDEIEGQFKFKLTMFIAPLNCNSPVIVAMRTVMYT
jgi:hypothetical protein